MSQHVAKTVLESPPEHFQPSNPNLCQQNSTETRTTTSAPDIPSIPTCGDRDASHHEVKNIPNVTLETEFISAAMAARLSISLLGHVLFLKSQIPFPVVQLLRMSAMPSDSKAAKKRMELVSAIDTLASHLQTTFIALSSVSTQVERANIHENVSNIPEAHAATTRAQMMFVIGPSVGAAKAKVVLVLDGLEVKLVGNRDEPQAEKTLATANSDIDDDVVTRLTALHIHSESSEGSGTEQENVDDGSDANSSDDRQSSGNQEDIADPKPEPWPSLSHRPSPAPVSTFSPASTSLAHTLRPDPVSSNQKTPLGLSPVPDSQISQMSNARSMPPPTQSRAEEQDLLRSADRLLSRTLANACAEDDGGLSSELAVTQTHVLLKAPRRFVHPAWTPRQNLTRSLESTLSTVIGNATSNPDHDGGLDGKKKAVRIGVKSEGVWIGCRTVTSENKSPASEEDEMIWWQWNSKIVGFSDW